MVSQKTIVFFNYFIISIIVSPVVVALQLPNQITPKPRPIHKTSTTEPGSGSLVTPVSTASRDSDTETTTFRFIKQKDSKTCILLKSDVIIDVNFLLHNLPEEANTYVPRDALVDGGCEEEDSEYLSISWKGYKLLLNFAKTPGGEQWYIKNIELAVSPDLPKLHGVQTHGRLIKLYHRKMVIPTSAGKSYKCDEVAIDLQPDEDDHPPPGLNGSLLLRKLQIQPFMYKSENFEEAVQCKMQRAYRDETAPIAVGSTLAVAVLMTVAGYGIFRYFKIKNVQYNTME